jgi:hypothetical protein
MTIIIKTRAKNNLLNVITQGLRDTDYNNHQKIIWESTHMYIRYKRKVLRFFNPENYNPITPLITLL